MAVIWKECYRLNLWTLLVKLSTGGCCRTHVILVQVMAWCPQASCHYPSQCWPISSRHMGSQWIEVFWYFETMIWQCATSYFEYGKYVKRRASEAVFSESLLSHDVPMWFKGARPFYNSYSTLTLAMRPFGQMRWAQIWMIWHTAIKWRNNRPAIFASGYVGKALMPDQHQAII